MAFLKSLGTREAKTSVVVCQVAGSRALLIKYEISVLYRK